MASKRAGDKVNCSSEMPLKRVHSVSEQICMKGVSSLEEMDVKVLRFQNRKLSEQIERRRRAEQELKQRIEHLENRQMTVDAVLNIVNRYWNQLDEDVQLLLERFDALHQPEPPTFAAPSHHDLDAATESFLTKLYSWDRQDVEQHLLQRVQFSTRAVGKLQVTLDRQLKRYHNVLAAFAERGVAGSGDATAAADCKPVPEAGCARSPGSQQLPADAFVKSEPLLGDVAMPYAAAVGDSAEPAASNHVALLNHDSSPPLDTQPQPAPMHIDNADCDNALNGPPRFAEPLATRRLAPDQPLKPALVKTLPDSPPPPLPVYDEIEHLLNENKRLHVLIINLQAKHHTIGLKNASLDDSLADMQTQRDELQNKVEELEFQLDESKRSMEKLDRRLSELKEKKWPAEQAGNNLDASAASRNDETHYELEEQKELAQNRLNELEAAQARLAASMAQVERLKLEMQELPDRVVHDSVAYKSLQAHFSVLYNESRQMRDHLQAARAETHSVQDAHSIELARLDAERNALHKRLQHELLDAEQKYKDLKLQYDELLSQLRQAQTANDILAPINKEMRSLINCMQTESTQLKNEINRYKRKLKDAQTEMGKLKAHLHYVQQQQQQQQQQLLLHQQSQRSSGEKAPPAAVAAASPAAASGALFAHPADAQPQPADAATCAPADDALDPNSSLPVDRPNPALPSEPKQPSLDLAQTNSAADSHDTPLPLDAPDARHDAEPKTAKASPSTLSSASTASSPANQGSATLSRSVGISSCTKPTDTVCQSPRQDNEIIKDLKMQLKKAQDGMRELKQLVDSYKNVNRETREKVQLMHSERKLRGEVEELRRQVARSPAGGGWSTPADATGANRRRMSEDDALRKIRKLEDSVVELQKKLHIQKQEEDALTHEMEVTMKAYEDLMEKNKELQKHLQEKDDLNFKLMSERMMANQLLGVLREEKEAMNQKLQQLHEVISKQDSVQREMEQREQLGEAQMRCVERESVLRQQTMELLEKKTLEQRQQIDDLRASLDKYQTLLREAQAALVDKTGSLEAHIYKQHRLSEENASLRRQLDRYHRFQQANANDEVLLEEIREYKEQLTCPSCKVKTKDTVLTKCFHVFCSDCLKVRYETRQRKCPKCNAAFGANDFHRIYLC